MKKIIAFALLCTLVLSAFTAFAANPVQDALQKAATMTREELAAAAKAEIGDNTLLFKGASSGIKKAAKAFTEKYGIQAGEGTLGSKDTSTYQGITTAMDANEYVVDLLLLQDTSQMMLFVDMEDFYNFVPSTLEGVKESDLDPLTCLYCSKQFTYTKANADDPEMLYNVWQLTGKGKDPVDKLSVQDPTTEGINMSMLVMLTHPDMQAKLTSAYEAYFGEAYKANPDFENISYEFIAGFINNVSSWHDSDTSTSKNLATGLYTINDAEPAGIAPGTVVYVPYAKCKDINKIIKPEEGEQKPELLNNFEFSGNTADIDGFNGFVYKMYLQVPRTAKYPYTAALFIDYILTLEGFEAAWGGNYGYYCGNANVPSADGKSIHEWSNMLIEDPAYIYDNFDDVRAFVVATKGNAQ